MLNEEQRAVLESLACMSSPYENEILWSILANEKASAIHLDNAAIERARDAWFDNSGSFESRLRAAISAASAAPASDSAVFDALEKLAKGFTRPTDRQFMRHVISTTRALLNEATETVNADA